MGVTISSKRYSCDMGYGGFMRFRSTVASMVSAKFYKHYTEMDSVDVLLLYGDERKKYFEKYDLKTKELVENGEVTIEVANFLYQPDSNGSIDRRQAKQVFELIKNCEDDVAFGYIGRSDCAKMLDLKKIFSDKTKVEWD